MNLLKLSNRSPDRKRTKQGDKLNQYTVVADRRANKIQIRQAVQELFKVKVLK